MVSSKPPGPLQQFLCPLQKINSCLGTSQMAPVSIHRPQTFRSLERVQEGKTLSIQMFKCYRVLFIEARVLAELE